MLGAAIHGILLAFGLILPLGVQNVFVFNQGAAGRKLRRAMPAVLTAAAGDTILILLAVLGVSVLVLSWSWLKIALFAAGAAFMLYIGWTIWRDASAPASAGPSGLPAKKQVVFALSVTFLNPHAILDTVGVIGTSSLGYTGGPKWAFTLATILVSWLWFIGLAMAGKIVGSLDRGGALLRGINRASALIVWGMAIYLLYTGFFV
ncbi:LysE/ArgO family amino acid transporter [Paenibacillus phocaensis]|uniref:LysE/ArgO family amino acid transporter n=1 Tax=Paenibacillus phocaensis TaxID=1776378 RepID=UPI00039EC268|nr:LysE/ArgO family amino acid transporter [Paenibacillus phocaensis]